MWPSSSPSGHAVLGLNSTRPSHRRRRIRLELQLERLEDRQLLSGPGSAVYQFEFGTAQSPLEPGFIRVAATPYDALQINTASQPVASPQVVSEIVVNAGGVYLGKAQSAVRFSGSAHDSNKPHAVFTYTWNFGDGTSATGASPLHTYSLDGIYNVTLTAKESNGSSAQATTTARVSPVAVAGSGLTGNEGSTFNFHGSAIGASLTYLWNFGDGSTASGTLTPSHVYVNPGAYTASLTVTDSAGLSGSLTLVATVNDVAPTVSLTDPASAQVHASVVFTATATSPSPAVQAAGFTYAWNFGDGTTGSGATASHSFATAGTYTVKATAKDEYGKTGTATGTITIFSGPVVKAGSPLTVNAGSSLTFSQATESGGTAPFAYTWNFDDGTNQTGSLNPSHIYPNPGSYTATLTVTDTNQLTSNSSVVATVNDVAPTVTITDPPATVGVPVSFTASASDVSPAVQAAGFTYAWSFGDGSTGSGASTSHTYASAATYTVSVSATDEYGETGTATETITILSAPVVNAGPAVTVNAASSVTFSQATESGGTAPFSYTWSFGDGTTQSADSLNPSHTYLNPGNYTATVTVTDANNLSSSGSVVVTVNDVAPTVSLSAPSSGVTGQAVSFTASATSPSPVVQAAGFVYNWNFGDGTTGTGAATSHTYTATGTYTVSVTATDEDRAMGNATRVLAIVTAFTVSAGSNLSTNEGTSVTFAGSASGGAAPYTYSWNFGDGSAGSGATPSHTYEDSGTYTATLSATDSSGQSGSGTAVVTVADVPPTVTLGGPSSGTVGSSLSFTASATDPSPADQTAGFTYSWNFGDGGTATIASPSHTFASAGTYTVTVTATDEYGETGTASGTISVTGSSPVLFHDTFSSNTPSPAWSFVNGTWQINNGVLSQTTELAQSIQKAMITNQTYPSNLIITAEVRVDNWNPWNGGSRRCRPEHQHEHGRRLQPPLYQYQPGSVRGRRMDLGQRLHLQLAGGHLVLVPTRGNQRDLGGQSVGGRDYRTPELDVPADGMDPRNGRSAVAQRRFGRIHRLIRQCFGHDDQHPARQCERGLCDRSDDGIGGDLQSGHGHWNRPAQLRMELRRRRHGHRCPQPHLHLPEPRHLHRPVDRHRCPRNSRDEHRDGGGQQRANHDEPERSLNRYNRHGGELHGQRSGQQPGASSGGFGLCLDLW